MPDCEGKAFRDANAVIKENQFIRFTTNQEAAPTRRVTHTDGREYLVAPTVAIVEGVMNELLYTEDEIAAYIEAWNGKPLVFDHPIGRGGEEDFISANSPEIFAQSPGYFFNATFDDNRLRGEWWIDLAKCRRLPQGNDLIAKLEAGDLIEQSTGLFTDVEYMTGEFNGNHYEGIARNIRPDHVAILLDDIGACSIEDGCGTPRINVEQEQPEEEPTEVKVNQAQPDCDCPDTISAPPLPPIQPVNGSLKSAWAIIARALGFENNDQQQEESINNQEGENMEREAVIQQILELAEMKGLPLTGMMLEAASDEDLMMLLSSMQPEVMEEDEEANEEQEEQPEPAPAVPELSQPDQPAPQVPAIPQVPAANMDGEDEEDKPAPSGMLALPNEVKELTAMLSAVGGVSALKDMIEQFKATANEEIEGLLSLISANSDFTQKELKDMPVPTLKKLAANICQPVPDYSGRGGGLQTQDSEWSYGWDREVQ